MKPFKEEFTLEERAKESAAMIASYPARIPACDVHNYFSLTTCFSYQFPPSFKFLMLLPLYKLRAAMPSNFANSQLLVIVERFSRSSLPEMEKRKYLVPCDMPVGQFIFILRSRLHLSPGIALFVFVNNTLPQTAQLMGSVYESYKDEGDGFLYMCYSSEKTFG